MQVSIVTISFNQAPFVERTIASVLGQDYHRIEYIVVDPGSTDGSREIIERHRSGIGKIMFRPDRGAADGLNNGFSEATGDVFGFLNSDDLLLPGAISSAVQFFQKYPALDVVSGHGFLIGPDDKVLRKLYSDRMSARKFLYGGAILIQPSTFFRAKAFRRVGGFNVKNKAIWDGELFLEMSLAGAKFAVANQFWSAYRIHPDSITGSKRLKERMIQTRNQMFMRVQGRSPAFYDRLLCSAFRVYRHIANPLDSLERIRHGPVFGRPIIP